MGIPSYFSYIVRQHRSIIRPYIKNNEEIDNLYLDANSIIYDAVQKDQQLRVNIMDESKLIDAVCEQLCYYIHVISPSKQVFIAFDGVAPLAKMNQQRNRRYMSILLEDQKEKTERDKQAQAQEQKQEQKQKKKQWNTSAITPGTEFMKQLGIGIHNRFFQKEKEFGLEKIKISTAEEAGEGEHKIYEYIRGNKEYHKNTKTVIYGLDADLIMLTLNHLHISSEMYLFRETPHFIQHIDKTLDPNGQYLMNINEFGDSIIREFTGGQEIIKVNVNTDMKASYENKIFDYIFMCFFLGNDFLPHFPSLNIRTNGINYLMNAYKQIFPPNAIVNLTNEKGNIIVWKNVRKFIEYLSANELNYIQGEYKKRDRMTKFNNYSNSNNNYNKDKSAAAEEDDYLSLPMKERSIEKYINPFEKGWEQRYYKTLFEGKITEQTKKDSCVNYLQGLEWTMNYYTTGCVDWRWNYKYHYPPLLTDLIGHVPYFDTCFVPYQIKNPVLPLVQLSYVLPERSLYLLPPKLQKALLASHPEWYTSDCDLKWSFCKYLWEAHASLPDIDISSLEKLINEDK